MKVTSAMSPSPSVGDEGIDERGVCYGWRARRSSSSSASPSVTHRHATVGRSKNGASRLVPMNAVVRSVLIDAATRRKHPNDPDASIFAGAYRTVARAFTQAVSRAQAALPLGVRIPRPPPLLKHLHRTQFPEQVVNGAPLGHFLAMSAFCDPREGLRSCTARLRPLKPLGQDGGPTWP